MLSGEIPIFRVPFTIDICDRDKIKSDSLFLPMTTKVFDDSGRGKRSYSPFPMRRLAFFVQKPIFKRESFTYLKQRDHQKQRISSLYMGDHNETLWEG